MQERFKNFTVLIANLSRCIHRIKTVGMAEFNLKSSHVSCLYYLYKEETLTAKGLCDVCGEDKANVSRSVKYLEENGYIRRASNAVKRYQSPLELTEKGAKTGKRLSEKIDCILNLASVGISDEDRKVMYRSLGIINENLNKLCENYDLTDGVL